MKKLVVILFLLVGLLLPSSDVFAQYSISQSGDLRNVRLRNALQAPLEGDITNSTTTLSDVSGSANSAFAIDISASTTCYFNFTVAFQTAATTTGIKLAVNGPDSPTYVVYETKIPTDAAGSFHVEQCTTWDCGSATSGIDAANTSRLANITGVVSRGATGGYLTLRFASEVAGSTVTILKGSYGMVWCW
jgi:hypothetical protein